MYDSSGPAFPVPIGVDIDIARAGMTLRDWFAGQVDVSGDYCSHIMEAVVGRKSPTWGDDPIGYLKYTAEFEAALRGIKADAMLAEREKE